MADLIALDPTLSGRENLRYELAQHKETGHDTTAVERALSRLPNDAPQEAFWELFDALAESPRVPDWPYVEPSTYDEIVATLPVVDATPPRTWSRAELTDRVLGGWLGRIAGCNLGKPIEWDEHWTRAHIRSYLESVGAYPLLDYVPKADDVSERYRFLPNWTETTRGRVHGSARDDDLDYSIIGLHLLERWGRGYTSEDVAGEWLLLLPILQTGAERVNLRNLVAGLRPPLTASHHNPHREWVGALIAAAFTAADAREAVPVSVEHIPPTSRLAEAVRRVLGGTTKGGPGTRPRTGSTRRTATTTGSTPSTTPPRWPPGCSGPRATSPPRSA